jgi:HEAT repeat protein
MRTVSLSDTFIQATEIAVLVFVGIVVLLAVAVVVVERRNARWTRRRAVLEARWRAFLIGEVPDPPPLPVTDRDRTAVLVLFNELTQEPVGSAPFPGRPTAAAAGRRACLGHVAAALLDGGDADKVVAFHALARLGGNAAAEVARAYVDHPGTELSRAAARCLLLIDPDALAPVLDRVRRRPDWGPTRVAAMLSEIDPHAVGDGLASAIDRSQEAGDIGGTVRLLGFLSYGSPEVARDACRRVLAPIGNSELLAAALRGLAEVALPGDAAVARRHARDTRAHVRLAAIRVLRAVGAGEDLALLESMVTDPDHWVRRRAAEALVALGDVGAGPPPIGALAAVVDANARAALVQAVADARFTGLKGWPASRAIGPRIAR